MTTNNDCRQRPETIGKPWIWFDLDDTLYDFAANSLTALAMVYDELQLQRFWPDVDTWIDEYHQVNSTLWRQYSHAEITRDTLRMERFRRPLTARGCDDRTARVLSKELDTIYLGHLAKLEKTVEGAHDVLQRLVPLYNIGVISNGFKEVQHGKIHSAGLAPYIDCLVLSDDIDVNKPDPRIFRYAEQKAGTTADHCLLIGDNPDTDIAGALAAGWKAIWFNPSRNISQQAITDAIQIQNLSQIVGAKPTLGPLLGLNIKKSI